MNCEQAQNELLSAESLNMLGPELSAHLADCPKCQALLAQLRRLDVATKALPVPAGHEEPSPEFLKTVATVAARSGMHARRFIRRAMAAAVVLAFGLAALSLLLFNGSTVQADILIGNLVDWNLQISHTHDAASRARIYQQQLDQLQKQANSLHLAAADQAIVQALLNNARWMTTEENSTEEAQHFHAIADQLLARQQATTDGTAAHYQQIYRKLMVQGVGGDGTVPTTPATSPQSSASMPSDFASRSIDGSNVSVSVANEAVADAGAAATNSKISGSPASGYFASNTSGALGAASHQAMNAESLSHMAASRSHHSESHVGTSGSGSVLGSSSIESGHGSSTSANVTTANQNTHTASQLISHGNLNTSLGISAHPCTSDDSSPSSPEILANMSGLTVTPTHSPPDFASRPFSRLGTSRDFEAIGAIAGGHTVTGLFADTSDAWGTPPENQIAKMLRQHVMDNQEDGEFEGFGMPPPPPAGLSGETMVAPPAFGGIESAPVPFPEPAIGFAVPILTLALRRRRRH